MPMSQENVEIVQEGWDAWLRGDLPGLFRHFDPDADLGYQSLSRLAGIQLGDRRRSPRSRRCADGKVTRIDNYEDRGPKPSKPPGCGTSYPSAAIACSMRSWRRRAPGGYTPFIRIE